jgi:6-pyruvoyltetrahydropterin/6-carboxytetrahydropterin synthase
LRQEQTVLGQFELTIESQFSAAHRLREYNGDCERLHGHNWQVRVTVRSSRLDRLGMIVDFRTLKRIVREVLGEFDHAYLNDLPRFAERNPTTEHMAESISCEVAERLPDGVEVAEVTAWETPGCSATYRP